MTFVCASALDALPALAGDELVALDVSHPKLVCEATDTYCKVSMKLTRAFPQAAVENVDRVAVECVARIKVRHERSSERSMAFVRTANVPLVKAAVDREFEVGFDFPREVSSIRLESVACNAAIRAVVGTTGSAWPSTKHPLSSAPL